MVQEKLFTRPFVLCSLANHTQAFAFNLFLHFPRFLNRLGADDLEIGAIAVRPQARATAAGVVVVGTALFAGWDRGR